MKFWKELWLRYVGMGLGIHFFLSVVWSMTSGFWAGWATPDSNPLTWSLSRQIIFSTSSLGGLLVLAHVARKIGPRVGTWGSSRFYALNIAWVFVGVYLGRAISVVAPFERFSAWTSKLFSRFFL